MMSALYVEVNGTGPDLVLLHGWGLNVRVWDRLVQELSDRFRMIAVDLPGHGRSAQIAGQGTPAEKAWLLHSTLASVSNRYSLLGWSLGAQIALDLAAAMPSQIDRLVLVAATARFASAPDWPYGMQPNAIAKLATQLRENYQQTISDFLELQVRGSIEGANVVAQLRKALLEHGHAQPEALEAGLNTLATSDLRATLPHVRTPSLVIAGQNDRITAPAASRALAAALPDAQYVEMRRAAHAPFLSHRREFAVLVDRFLRGAAVNEGTAAAVTPSAAVMTVGAAATPRAATMTVGDTATRNAAPVAAGDTATSNAAMTTGAMTTRDAIAKALDATAAPNAMKAAGSGHTTAGSSTVETAQPRRAKKKRMKARARKKLQASSR